MALIKTIVEAEELLARHVPAVKAVTGKQMTLERMRPLMEALGNPQQRIKIIHVAGTSGKTSTSYFIAALLTSAGRKVGLTVSPHIDTVTERIQIDMQPLSEQEFVAALHEYMDIIGRTDLHPTYFELLVSMAYWYFDKAGVDYAVVETGLGGMHDGTNIAQDPDKLCVITDIGLDHMHILGDTVRQIAAQKAGIIHEQNEVFVQPQDDEILDVLRRHCEEKGAHLHLAQEAEETMPESLPEFQKRNASLAYQVFSFVRERDNLVSVSAKRLEDVRVPGRMTEVSIGGKTIVMDGAHNEQKMQAFISSFQEKYPDKKVPVLFGLKQGKEVVAVLPLLRQITDTLIITEYEWMQDLPVASLDAYELAAAAKRFGYTDVKVEKGKYEAYSHLLECVQDVGVITGSFYLIGQLRQGHEELKA